jgi:acyl carrier protein
MFCAYRCCAPYPKEQVVTALVSEITEILCKVLHDDELALTPATRFGDLNGWEPMDLITVVVEVECRFDLQFALVEIDRLTAVGDLVRMIEAKQASAAA